MVIIKQNFSIKVLCKPLTKDVLGFLDQTYILNGLTNLSQSPQGRAELGTREFKVDISGGITLKPDIRHQYMYNEGRRRF